MSFKLHKNNRITITAGDSAELDLRLFNKDSLPRFPKFIPKKLPYELPLLNGKGELLWKMIQVQAIDSEGKPIFEEDSEGKLIPVMIPNFVPVYPMDLKHGYVPVDSEGFKVIPWVRTPEGLKMFGDFDFEPNPSMFPDRFPWKYGSGFHQLQEEFIEGKLVLKVRDLQGNIVLEKENDEFINTIFFDKEDTINLKPGLYTYQISYITDKDTDMEEEQTIVDEAFFEVYKKYTVSEN